MGWGWGAFWIISSWCFKSFQQKYGEKNPETVAQRESIIAHQNKKGIVLTLRLNFQNYFIHP